MTIFWIKCIQNGLYLLRSFEGGDQVPLLVIKGEIRQVADLIKRRQKEFLVAAKLDIRMLFHLIMRIELPELAKWLIGGHNDIDILELLEIR